MFGWLKSWLLGPETGDGLGFSFAKEVRLAWRVRQLRRMPVVWRKPDQAECELYDTHTLIGDLADYTVALADIDGRRWVVRDRIWYGWPDPPEFVAIAFDGDEIWSAADFNNWPSGWTGVDRPTSGTAPKEAAVHE